MSPAATDPRTIEIRPLATKSELRACVALQQSTWGADFSEVVPATILNVVQRIGGVAAGAFDSQNTLLGFVFGMTGVEAGKTVHWSDMLAVAPIARNLGLGRRLKEHQRQVVRSLGATVIYWTVDPLVARNAHLNFNRLGAGVAQYVEDMYGATDSILHGGVATDRLIVAWPTRDDEVGQRLACARRVATSTDCQTAPVVAADWIADASGATILPHCLRVEIPTDADRLMLESPDRAIVWRMDVRQNVQWAMSAGYSITAFFKDPKLERAFYLMTRPICLAGSNEGRGR